MTPVASLSIVPMGVTTPYTTYGQMGTGLVTAAAMQTFLMLRGRNVWSLETVYGHMDTNRSWQNQLEWSFIFYFPYRAAAFDVTGRKTFATLSVILRFAHKIARQEIVSSTVILEMQTAWNLRSTTVSTVAVAQLPCRLN